MLAQNEEAQRCTDRPRWSEDIEALAGPTLPPPGRLDDSTKSSASLRDYEQLIIRAQGVAGRLSSPKTLRDEQSDEDVRQARSTLPGTRTICRAPVVVASLEARQTELQASRRASAAQSVAKGEQAEAGSAGECRASRPSKGRYEEEASDSCRYGRFLPRARDWSC